MAATRPLLQLTARFDATERAPTALRVDPAEAAAALAALDAGAARGAGASRRPTSAPSPRRSSAPSASLVAAPGAGA